MSVENEIFKRHIPDYEKLVRYGFVEQKDGYVFKQKFLNDEFIAQIVILKNGAVSGKVYDSDNKEEYIPLRLETQRGAFVGEVRAEYEKFLLDICKNCFTENLFIYPQANRIANLILENYGNTPKFMWEKFPNFGVYKNPDNDKWFGAIMNINYSKLDYTKDEEVEILNVKLDKKEIQELLKKDGFYPAWHMNKKNWITIILNETLCDEDVMKYIEESRSYTISKKR